MGLNTIRVTNEVDGEYTLPELLDLLGSPKKLKEALSELKNAAKKADAATKAIAKAEAQRQATIKADTSERDKREADAVAAESKAIDAQRKLATAKSKKRDELNERESRLLVAEMELIEHAKIADEKDTVLKNGLADLAADRIVFEETVAKAQKEINKDMEAAEKYRQDALQIRRESDDKVEAMRKALA